MTDTEAHEERRKAKAKLIIAEANNEGIRTPGTINARKRAQAEYDIAMLNTETERQKKIHDVCIAIDNNIAELKSLMNS